MNGEFVASEDASEDARLLCYVREVDEEEGEGGEGGSRWFIL